MKIFHKSSQSIKNMDVPEKMLLILCIVLAIANLICFFITYKWYALAAAILCIIAIIASIKVNR